MLLLALAPRLLLAAVGVSYGGVLGRARLKSSFCLPLISCIPPPVLGKLYSHSNVNYTDGGMAEPALLWRVGDPHLSSGGCSSVHLPHPKAFDHGSLEARWPCSSRAARRVCIYLSNKAVC